MMLGEKVSDRDLSACPPPVLVHWGEQSETERAQEKWGE